MPVHMVKRWQRLEVLLFEICLILLIAWIYYGEKERMGRIKYVCENCSLTFPVVMVHS